jgi:hypothetical protein
VCASGRRGEETKVAPTGTHPCFSIAHPIAQSLCGLEVEKHEDKFDSQFRNKRAA